MALFHPSIMEETRIFHASIQLLDGYVIKAILFTSNVFSMINCTMMQYLPTNICSTVRKGDRYRRRKRQVIYITLNLLG